MSKEIEQKVVEMRFDNRQFESATAQSMSTIEKLKQKLNFSGVSKGFENIDKSVRKVDMSGLGKSVETVNAKFSALEVVGVTALANITNSAVNAGKRIVSALTIDPIKTGFEEYETQINAVQTILANTQSKGSTLEDVNAALDELNKYADMTIYNFTEMTRNIGTFTAAGVDLDKSVTSIKGIANLAAVSGSNAQQASTAMYQLSQALAAGTVQLMDWNSVVNAGMGGELFQNALKRTAAQMGTNVDALIEKYGSFRESLTKGKWLTAEVLTETLTQLSGAYTEADLIAQGYSEKQAKEITQLAQTAVDAATKVKTFSQLWDTLKEAAQSGWTQTWEIIIGDFEEAKEFLTGLSDLFGGIIGKMSDARNNLLEGALGSKWGQLTDKINEAGVATEDFNSELEKTVKNHGINVDALIKEYGSLEKAFAKGALSSDLIVETLKRMAGVTGEATKSTEDMTGKLEYFQKVVNDVWRGDYKNGAERVKALTAAGYDYAQVQSLVNKTVDGHKLTLEDLSDAQLKSVGYTNEEITKLRELAKQAEETGTPLNKLIEDLNKPSGRELLLDTLMNAIHGVIDSLGAVKKAWTDIFPPMTSDQLYNIIEGLHALSTNLIVSEERADKITRTFKGLFAILDILSTILGSGIKLGFTLLSKLLGIADLDILSVTASMGDAVVAFRDFLFENNAVVKGIEKLGSGLRSGVSTVREWVKEFMELPIVQKYVTKFNDAFSDTISNFQDYFGEGIKRFGEFIDRAKSIDSLSFENIKAVLIDFKDNVIGYFLNIGGVFTDLKETFSEFKADFKAYFDAAGESVDTLLGKLVNFALAVKEKFNENIGLGEIMTIALGIGIILTAKKIGDALEIIAGPISGFSDVLDSLSGVLNAYSKKVKAEALFTIAKAIATLAGSVAVLALLDQSKVWSSVGALAALAVTLVGISAAMGKLNTATGTIKGSTSLLSLTSAVLILVVALKQLDGIDRDNILGNLAIIGSLIAGLVGASVAMSKMAPSLSSGSVFLLSFAASLKILVSALQDLNELDSANLGRSITILIGAMGALSLLSASAKGMKFGSGVSILAIAVALKMLIGSFKTISELDTGMMRANMDAFIAIFGMFAVLMASSKLAGANAAKAGLGIIAMSAALILIVQSFKMMAGIEPDELDRATKSVSQLLIVFGAVVALSNFAGQHAAKAGGMLLMMSGAIAVLAGVMVILSHIDPEGLDRALGAIVTLELIFGALIAVTKLANGDVKGTLMMLAISVGLMAAALGALSMIDQENLRNATVSLSAVIGVFSLLVASTNLAKSAVGTIVVMTAAVAALGGVLVMLSGLPAGSALSSAEALSLLLASLSASMLIISNVGKVAPSAYATLGIMLLTVGGLAAILTIMSKMEVKSSLEIAESLSMLLLSLSGACAILALVGKVGAASALQGALALDGVIVIVGGLLAGIGALAAYYPQLEEFVNKGVGLIEAVGRGIGSFFGGIVGGIAAGVTSGLPDIGTNMSEFMENAKPFFDGIKVVDSEAMNGVKALAETILILTAADVLNSLTSWLTGGSSLVTFGEDIAEFGKYFKQYAENVSGIDSNVVESSANAAKTLAEFASAIPNSGGYLATWVGDNTLSKFAEELNSFAPALKKYSDTITADGGIDGAAVESSANAAKTLAAFADAVPNTGGYLATWVGDNSLSTFANELKAFAPALKEYSDIITSNGGIDGTAVESSANAAKSLAAFASAVPNKGGYLATWLGDNSLTDFADELKAFAPALKEYSNIVTADGGINGAAVEASANAAKCLAELEANLPSHGGLMQWFSGDNTLDTFGESLVSFGRDFRIYSNYMTGVDSNIITTTTNAAQSLVALANNLPEDKLFRNETWLNEFGSQLSEFGGYFSDYYNSVSGIDVSRLYSVITQANNLVDMAKGMSNVDFKGMNSFGKALANLGSQGVEDFINAFSNASSRVTSAATSMVDAFISGAQSKQSSITDTFSGLLDNALTAFNTRLTSFETAGSDAASQFGIGIGKKSGTVIITFNEIVSRTLTSVRGQYAAFSSAGSYLVDGFASGIKSNSWKALEEARTLASKITETTQNALEIHSPSQVFYGIGGYVVQGFVNGIKDRFSNVTNTSMQLGANLLNTIQSYLGIHSPSTVMRDKVGRFIVDGIAEGITEEMTAEEAAKQKAQNIADAFTEAFNKIDLGETTANLEYQLWEALNGADLTDTQKSEAQMGQLKNQISTQTQRVQYANAQYQANLKAFGASSQEAKESYNDLLQAQIDLASLVEEYNEIAKSLNENQDTLAENNRQAALAYVDFLTQNQEALLKLGHSMEEIEKEALRVSGYDPNFTADTDKYELLDVKKIVDDAMAAVEVVLKDGLKKTAEKVTTESTKVGETVAKSISNGVSSSKESVTTVTTQTVEACVSKINEQQPKWVEAGSYLVDGFIQGIKSKIDEAAQVAAAMAAQAYEAAVSQFSSSSNVSTAHEAGSALSLAFAQGIESGENALKGSASSAGKSAVNTMKSAITTITDSLDQVLDSNPVIKPVLDLTGVTSGMGVIHTLFNKTQATTIGASVNNKVAANNQNGSSSTTSGATYQFTQNNYSPKALSRVEIYRQTNNQLSALERMSKK